MALLGSVFGVLLVALAGCSPEGASTANTKSTPASAIVHSGPALGVGGPAKSLFASAPKCREASEELEEQQYQCSGEMPTFATTALVARLPE